ncbi:histone-lysine N-methyltransferase, H3 lysine-79 specific-like isoform X2 [Salvelinus alpinus]|uniref:histone-lysine N-methyltransferase, H3 lysine-79 specific-like isoform X2 n=1 Tax=Salvelinus alpinus TaxID=8036 RepID=UPI0039FDDDC0
MTFWKFDFGQKTVASELKKLFQALNEGTTDTKRISSELGIRDVHQQSDAAECLEKILSKHDDAPKIFEGRLKYSYTCLTGHETFDRSDSIWTLPLSMEKNPHSWGGNYSVTDEFHKFFQPASVGGDMMYCDVCQGKAEATIACEMEHPPEILTLHLKRFKVDYSRNTLVKNDCCVEVPHTLQIKSDVYELYAMVDHSGHIRGGHYTATIKSYEDQKWYCFDDANVTPIAQPPSTSCSAYLIMYKRSDLVQGLSTYESCEGADRQKGQNDGVTNEDEEKNRREKDHMLREQELTTREEEYMLREGALRRREEDHMWRENNTRRREVEGMRREEERMRREEALTRRENTFTTREEDLKKIEEKYMLREGALRRREDELKRREDNKGREELKKGEEGKIRRADKGSEELKTREEEKIRREDELKRREDNTGSEELKKREEEQIRREDELKRSEELKKREEQKIRREDNKGREELKKGEVEKIRRADKGLKN